MSKVLRLISRSIQGLLEVHFRIKYGVSLGRLKKAYADSVNKNVHKLRFLFEGRRIDDFDTPVTLKMKDGDVIELYREQPYVID